MTPAEQLEATLREDIPLAQAIGIRIAGYDGATLRLTAPLAPNYNHKLTAFGGSLFSVAVLCGWGLLHLKLGEAGVHRHIVIQESNIRYRLPVTDPIRAECRVDVASFERLLHTLQRRDRARISLDVTIFQAGFTAVEFAGKYVVHS